MWPLKGPDSVKGIIETFGKYGILEGTLDKSIVTVLNFLNGVVVQSLFFSFFKNSFGIQLTFNSSFRCTEQWLDIYIIYNDPPIGLVPTWHHS